MMTLEHSRFRHVIDISNEREAFRTWWETFPILRVAWFLEEKERPGQLRYHYQQEYYWKRGRHSYVAAR